MPEEFLFPEVKDETQESLRRFWQQVYDRMHNDHPQLLEKHLPILEDTDPYGRLYAATAIHVIMDVIDARAAAKAAHEAYEQLQNEYRRLA